VIIARTVSSGSIVHSRGICEGKLLAEEKSGRPGELKAKPGEE